MPLPGPTSADGPEHLQKARDDEASRQLEGALHQIQSARGSLPANMHLYFLRPPHLYEAPLPRALNADHLTLDSNVASNSPFIGYHHQIIRAEDIAALYCNSSSPALRHSSQILSDTATRFGSLLRDRLVEEWGRQASLRYESHFVDTARHYKQLIQRLPPAVLAVYLLVSSLYLISNVSQADCTFLLGGILLVLNIAATCSCVVHTGTSGNNILQSVDKVVELLELHPQSDTFVCCRLCFCLYPTKSNSGEPSYPWTCTNRTDDGICNAKLRKKKKTSRGEKVVPVREFVYQSPQEYLSHLFSRPDLQDYLYRDPTSLPTDPNESWDIWEAPGLRDFKGPDGSPFTASSKESRLIFSLNFDGFNPYGSRQAGKVTTVGGIYLVCLNLPPAIRYKVENVYLVGIIPGPHGPSLEEINHLLKPVIDDFLILWEDGIYLSRTFSRNEGIRVRAAIVPLVCDLPAARQMSGSAGFMHTQFCSECKQTRKQLNDIDPSLWEPRTWAEHRNHAELWRKAATKAERASLLSAHGVRWSELLRLPYWDPTRYTIIDSMHAFYLRLFQYHVRNIWGMNVSLDDGPGITFDRPKNAPSERTMKKAHDVLRHGNRSQLGKLHYPVLLELCRDAGSLSLRGLKSDLLSRLLQYRIDIGWFTKEGKCVLEEDDVQVAGKSGDRGEMGKPGVGTVSAGKESPNAEMSGTGGRMDVDGLEGEEEINPKEDGYASYDSDKEYAAYYGGLEDPYESSEGEEDEFLGEGDDDPKGHSEAEMEDNGDVDSLEQDEPRGGGEGDIVMEDASLKHTKGYTEPLASKPHGGWSILKDDITNTEDAFYRGNKSLIKSARLPDLRLIYLEHVAPNSTQEGSKEDVSGLKREELISRIQSKRLQLGIVGEDGRLTGGATIKSKPRTPKGTRVLGRQTLEEIRSDMRSLNRPAWQANAPSHPGEAKWGKFTADQWQTFCTVNLPVTLVRLWGSAMPGSLERRRLDNYMHLVTAVKLATMNKMTEERIVAYEDNMQKYLETLLDLYPSANITPYQHLALHFGRHLRTFGPVHAWRCFPFERYNGIIQSVVTNNKFSELEKTMFTNFTAAQRIRSIFNNDEALPQSIRLLSTLFKSNYGTKYQTSVVDALLDNDRYHLEETGAWNSGYTSDINADVYKALTDFLKASVPAYNGSVDTKAQFHETCRRFSRNFSILAKSRTDSQVVFQLDPNADQWVAGTILNLFTHRRYEGTSAEATQVFAVISPYVELDAGDAAYDLYRRYPIVAGRLCYNELSDDAYLVPFTSIKSHFACQVQRVSSIQKECLLVLPLDKQ